MEDVRNDLYYTLERMSELKRQVIAGENAKKELEIYEENFKDLCKQVIEEGDEE